MAGEQEEEASQQGMHRLLLFGGGVCAEINRFHPDFVVVLLHSGWTVLHAARSIWEHTEKKPFPPVFPVNIGREKADRYQTHRIKLPFRQIDEFYGCFSDYREIGYFLNWITRQQDWISWIRSRTDQMGFDTKRVRRILILDDFISMGTTFYLSQMLFESSFPKAEVHFMANHCEWEKSFYKPWFEKHQVRLPDDPHHPICNAVGKVVNATADIASDSLDWQPLHSGLPDLQPLAEALPLETWMEMHPWIKCQIAEAVSEWVQAGMPGDNDSDITINELSPYELLFRCLWNHGTITSAEFAKMAKLSLREAMQILRHFYSEGFLNQLGTGRERCFYLAKVRPNTKRDGPPTLHVARTRPPRSGSVAPARSG